MDTTWVRTKIICTMGPSVTQHEKILELIDAGMNVARLNFSHGTYEQHRNTIALLKRAREEKGVPLAIMLDTKGPEIRLGMVPGGAFPVEAGQLLSLVRKPQEGKISIYPEIVFDFIEEGASILFDNGYIQSKLVQRTEEGIVVEFLNSGVLKNQKGVNIPNKKIPLPAMTQEDIDGIIFGCKEGIDLIAASFIRSAEHVKEIKKLLLEQKRPDIFVIAKIEDTQGVQNFDTILLEADGIMVARGDLGVEMPIYEVPSLQKMMIRRSYSSAKPVVTATQMLESMINNPRPTRAEVSDVANAIYDSTSAVMLSGETAVGLYPIQTVQMMRNIVIEAERKFPYRDFFSAESMQDVRDISFAVALAAVKTAYSVRAKAIFVFTSSGLTAKLISRYRPEIPIFALTATKEGYHRMALCWGVIPVPHYPAKNIAEAFSWVRDFAESRGFVQPGDIVLITAGAPFGVSGSTNMMLVETV